MNFIDENESENVVYKLAAILSQLQYGNGYATDLCRHDDAENVSPDVCIHTLLTGQFQHLLTETFIWSSAGGRSCSIRLSFLSLSFF